MTVFIMFFIILSLLLRRELADCPRRILGNQERVINFHCDPSVYLRRLLLGQGQCNQSRCRLRRQFGVVLQDGVSPPTLGAAF